MAEFKGHGTMTLTVTMTLTESEARFLEGMAGFDHKAIEKALIGVCGSYVTDHVGGLHTFLRSIEANLAGPLARIDKARQVFDGNLIAVKPKAADGYRVKDVMRKPDGSFIEVPK